MSAVQSIQYALIRVIFLGFLFVISMFVLSYKVQESAQEESVIHLSTIDDANELRPSKEEKLPPFEGKKISVFTWKYKNTSYSVEQDVFDSVYTYYTTRNIREFEGYRDKNTTEDEYGDLIYINGVPGDTTVSSLAKRLKKMSDTNGFSDDETVDFIASFIQSIPYDQEKTDNRKRGIQTFSERITYPYEVLYEKKGVCQDKSYLAYALLKELGYGVALFRFSDPDVNHMAVGVQCPNEYSNYSSGYCFLETTTVHNRIGIVPDSISSGNAFVTNMNTEEKHNELQKNNPLDAVIIEVAQRGKEYEGVINTRITEKKIENLKNQIISNKYTLKSLEASLGKQKKNIEDKNIRSQKEVKKLIEKYNQEALRYESLIQSSNEMIRQYNTLINDFYT